MIIVYSMKLSDLVGRDVLILGMGREGQAAMECLPRLVAGVRLTCADDDAARASKTLVQGVEGAPDGTVIIKSPGIPPTHVCMASLAKRGFLVTTSTDLLFNERKGKRCVVAITGTKGKSTTASLLAHTLKTGGINVELVGNIGVPALARIDAAGDTVFVCETSSYQAMDVTTGSDICIILNLFAEHMDYHGTVDAYWEAKVRLARMQKAGDLFAYDGRFSLLAKTAAETSAETIDCNEITSPAIELLQLFGSHNRENARAVVVVARRFGVTEEVMARAFASFKPLAHRLEPVGEVEGVLFVNDSISTVPQATLAAMTAFEGRLGAVILGGKDRGYDFGELAEALRRQPDVMIFVLPGGDRLMAALASVGVVYTSVASLEEAVRDCAGCVTKGKVCLLSPASPSYGFYKNFEDRGEQFRVAVRQGSQHP